MIASRSPIDRRAFLGRSTALALAGTAATLGSRFPAHAAENRLHLSTNAYSWHVFYQRDGRNFGESLEAGLAEVKASGIDGFEPGVGGPDEVRRLAPLLAKAGLEMRSLYVNSTLHTPADADRSLASILEVARECRPLGTRIIVTNPNPLQWGGDSLKTDAQLRTQADALNRLGRALRAEGITLAYHNHDIELRAAAREFHHMMAGTDPDLVSLCLDAHWIYRGAGNSQVALFDVVKLHGNRVSELHLRQSNENLWSETLAAGDIDYPALVAALQARGVKPHLVLEIAVEKGTPRTMSTVEAHRRSAVYARQTFAPLAP